MIQINNHVLFTSIKSKENSSRTHEIHGLQCELSSIRSERDALRVRFESSVLEVNRLRKDCENYRKTLELHLREQPYSSGPRETQDILTKTRLAALEVQLSAACAARNDALRHVGHLNAKLETTSKAFYEVFNPNSNVITCETTRTTAILLFTFVVRIQEESSGISSGS